MKPVTTLTATEARANLFKLLDQAAEHHEPIQITGRRHNGVLVSEEDFRAMQETLYLLGVPGVKASLMAAKKAPVRSYSRKRPW
jgi:prevent-host-death family protein